MIAAREAAAADDRGLLAGLAMQPPITEAVSDSCDTGRDDFKVQDPYYWTCWHYTVWVVPDPQTDPALLISAYRDHVDAAGCNPDPSDFDMTASYWATMGVAGENAHGEPYTVDSLPSVSAVCDDGQQIGIRFGTAAGVQSDEMLFAFTGREIIEQTPFDRVAIDSSTAPHVVTLSVGTNYHYISRAGNDDESTDPPSPRACFCSSGGTCECPGG